MDAEADADAPAPAPPLVTFWITVLPPIPNQWATANP